MLARAVSRPMMEPAAPPTQAVSVRIGTLWDELLRLEEISINTLGRRAGRDGYPSRGICRGRLKWGEPPGCWTCRVTPGRVASFCRAAAGFSAGRPGSGWARGGDWMSGADARAGRGTPW